MENEWFSQAACRGVATSIFFVDKGSTANAKKARDICQQCPVQSECLEYALESNEDLGIWGNTSPRERRKIRRERLQLSKKAS